MRTRRGDVITLTYDLGGRLLTRAGPDFPIDSFRYDPAGRWRIATNAVAYDSLVTDSTGRVVTSTQRQAGITDRWNYSYDIRDRLVQRVNALYPWVNPLRMAYDPATGSVDTLCAGGGCVATTQDVEQLPGTKIFNADGGDQFGEWSVSLDYNGLHNEQRTIYSHGNLDQLFGTTASFDSLGRLETESSGAGGARLYSYDPLGRLTNVCQPQEIQYQVVGTDSGFVVDTIIGGCVAVDGAPWSYDSTGNRTEGGATIAAGNRVTSFKGYTLTYDLNGNVRTKVGNGIADTLTWDALGRLVQVRRNGALLASFAYDALGRRASKTTGATERYVYDGGQVVLDLNASGQVLREYGWYPGVDRLLSLNSGGLIGVALTDPVVGSIRGVAQAYGAATLKVYPPNVWGEYPADTGLVTRFRLAGREYDQETKLYYLRARYYDPTLGRFLSEDPLGILGGLNLYAYAANDPVNRRDPTGLHHCREGDIHVTRVWWHEEYDPSRERKVVVDNIEFLCRPVLLTGDQEGQDSEVGPEGRRGSCGSEIRDVLISGAADLTLGLYKGIRLLTVGSRLAVQSARMARTSVQLAREGHIITAELPSVLAGQQEAHALAATRRGAAQIGRGAVGEAHTMSRANESGEAWWYFALKVAPFFGTGMELGEAGIACIP